MDSGSAEPPPPRFRFLDIFKLPVLHPFLVILVLMFVLQVNFHDDIMMVMMLMMVFLVILVLTFVLQVDFHDDDDDGDEMVMMLMMVFLVILVLTFVFQFCGQGAITFYTVRIFKVVFDVFISITFVVVQMFKVEMVVQDACSVVEAKDCALVIGVTYFLSALLRWTRC